MDTEQKCEHKDWVVILGCDSLSDCGLDNYYAHNYKNGETRQVISGWCRDCGALCIDRAWGLPRNSESETTEKQHYRIIWKCRKCGDQKTSDTREHHKMDTCWCESSSVDAELYYIRTTDSVEIIWRE